MARMTLVDADLWWGEAAWANGWRLSMNSTVTQFAQPGDRAVSPIVQILHGTWDDFRHEVVDEQIPLHLFNESVFRCLFIKRSRIEFREAEIQIEWNHVDLLWQLANESHLVEFKFYVALPWHRRLDKTWGHLKGGPGASNTRELGKCLQTLHTLKHLTKEGDLQFQSKSVVQVFGHGTELDTRNSYLKSFATYGDKSKDNRSDPEQHVRDVTRLPVIVFPRTTFTKVRDSSYQFHCQHYEIE